MTKIFTAGLVGFAMALCLPLSAASAKKAPAKGKASTTKSKTKTSAKAKKPAPSHYAQQHPTTDRYLEIQQALMDRGYLTSATGEWGPESVAALKKFQTEQRLPSDGKLGALSLRALGLGPRRGDTVEEAITAGILPANAGPTPLD
ncbi:MAG: peptidoglycan-binding domain-containing protein [Bryobacteraceae bacterium]